MRKVRITEGTLKALKMPAPGKRSYVWDAVLPGFGIMTTDTGSSSYPPSGERTLQEVVHNDLETGLHFLPVKAHTTTPIDLLESDRMRQLLQICRENYDLIVLDSAPVASVNDTKVAAGFADRVVFIVRWGKTIESAARDSVRALRESGIEPAGVVLSQIALRKHAQYRYGDIGQYYTRSRRYYVN